MNLSHAVTADYVIQRVAHGTYGAVILERATLRKWVQRGHITKLGRTSRGESLYDLRTVLEHLAALGITFVVPSDERGTG